MRSATRSIRDFGEQVTHRIVDLTLTLNDGIVTWETKPPFRLLPYTSASTFTLGFNTKLLIMEDHTGTHVDAPFHFYDGTHRQPRGHTVAEIPLEKLMGEAVLIDVSQKSPRDPVDRAMLERAAKAQETQIRSGDVVLVRFWPGAWGEPRKEFFETRGLTDDACEWLSERGAKCVGVDHPNLEGRLASEHGNLDSPGHLLFLHPEREVPIIENLVHLEAIRARRFRFAALPLKIAGATGSPVRAIAFVDDGS
jgi:arylformamidase